MADYLFPTFDMPVIPDEDEVEKFYPSAYFDFEKGDFSLDGANRVRKATGKEAFAQWCIKAINTERDTCLAYSEDYGAEFEEIAGDTPLSSKSDIEETITDTLMANPATEYVKDIDVVLEGDYAYVTLVVKGYDWDEEELSAVIAI